MRDVQIDIVSLPHFEGLPLPAYATGGSAGMDLRAAIEMPHTLAPGERWAVPTGLKMAIPLGYEGQVRPRSGLALRHGIGIVNSPGTIDADYRGELKVPLINLSRDPFVIERGMRVAQLIVAPVVRVGWRRVNDLESTERAEGGFGHTGNA